MRKTLRSRLGSPGSKGPGYFAMENASIKYTFGILIRMFRAIIRMPEPANDNKHWSKR